MPLCPTTEDTIQHRRKRVPQGLKSNVPLYSSLDITTNMKKNHFMTEIGWWSWYQWSGPSACKYASDIC